MIRIMLKTMEGNEIFAIFLVSSEHQHIVKRCAVPLRIQHDLQAGLKGQSFSGKKEARRDHYSHLDQD